MKLSKISYSTPFNYTTEGFLAIQKWETVSTYKDGKCILNEDDIGKMIRQKLIFLYLLSLLLHTPTAASCHSSSE